MNRRVGSELDRKWDEAKSAALTLALAAAFALVFYTCNTPLGAWIGSDNAMYLTMGTALAKGRAPYSGIFDHKGPLLFILQMLPQLFTGGYSTMAVFVQEVLFLWAGLLVLARMARRLGVRTLAVQLVYLAVYAPTLDGANLTEEYANLFTLIGLDTMLAVFGEGLSRDGEKKLFMPAFVMGAMAMLCFLTRANNALPLAGAVCALAAYLLFIRRFAGFGRCAAGFALGMTAAALPVIAWLAAHGALEDAFYGAIVHNFMYAETQGQSRVHTLLFEPYGHLAMLMAVLACMGALLSAVRTKRWPLAMAMVTGAAFGGFAGFISHKFYNHYLMLGVPMAALGAAQVLAFIRERFSRRFEKVCLAVSAVCVLALVIMGVPVNAQRERDRLAYKTMAPDAAALYEQVPEADRDHFLAYRVEPKWYVAAQALPCMRFYFLQEILADADPAVMDEIVEEFNTDPPRWVVLFYNRPFSPPYDARVQEIFDTRYEFVDARGEYQLLRLKEAP
ncbi:MAG: hypothetical protein IKJ11_02615 [Clostridia bacterium]|nr:hypothetical protein [Clostridia bacterium]